MIRDIVLEKTTMQNSFGYGFRLRVDYTDADGNPKALFLTTVEGVNNEVFAGGLRALAKRVEDGGSYFTGNGLISVKE